MPSDDDPPSDATDDAPATSSVRGEIATEWWGRADAAFPAATTKTELLRRAFETGVRYREREQRDRERSED